MKKTFGKQAMRIMAAALVMVLLMVPMASGEQSAWDCPECGRTGNLWNYCGNCAHPAPWTKEEGFDDEKAYDAVLKRLEEMDGKIVTLNDKIQIERITTDIQESIAPGSTKEIVVDISSLKQKYSKVYFLNFEGGNGSNYINFGFLFAYSASTKTYNVGIKNYSSKPQTLASINSMFLCIK